jgi:hypothetical protein
VWSFLEITVHESCSSLYDISIKMATGNMKDQGEYDTLRNLYHGSDSITEVGDWDAESDLRLRLQRRKTIWRKLAGYRWLLDTVLLLVIVGLLVDKRWKHHSHKSHTYEGVGDITGFAPTCEFSTEGYGNIS